MEFPLEKDDVKVLIEFGLTVNQSKIYLSLLKVGTPTEAAKIFQISGVTRQDVYRVLLELQKLGIVEKIISKPNKFIAVEPEKAVSILIDRRLRNINDLSERAEIFVRRAIGRYAKTQIPRGGEVFSIVAEKQATINKIKELIRKTKENLYIITPQREFLPALTIMEEPLKTIRGRNVKVRWITQTPNIENLTKIIDILSKNNHIEVMYMPEDASVKFVMSDEKEITLAVFEEGNFAEAPGLVTNSPAVVALAKNYFEVYWIKGSELIQNKISRELSVRHGSTGHIE